MKHLEDTIHQYHLQSEKNLEGIKCGFKNTRSVVFTLEFKIQRSKFNVIPLESDQSFFHGLQFYDRGLKKLQISKKSFESCR